MSFHCVSLRTLWTFSFLFTDSFCDHLATTYIHIYAQLLLPFVLLWFPLKRREERNKKIFSTLSLSQRKWTFINLVDCLRLLECFCNTSAISSTDKEKVSQWPWQRVNAFVLVVESLTSDCGSFLAMLISHYLSRFCMRLSGSLCLYVRSTCFLGSIWRVIKFDKWASCILQQHFTAIIMFLL